MDAHNTFEAPDTVHPVDFAGVTRAGAVTVQLPPKSVAVVAID
jgi:alpha-N-arabinofuranosidase